MVRIWLAAGLVFMTPSACKTASSGSGSRADARGEPVAGAAAPGAAPARNDGQRRPGGAHDLHQGGVQAEPCVEGRCGAGLSCVEYFGIAGPAGPKFDSCEIPCPGPNTKCPAGQTCITIADGPGEVCRPTP